MVISAVAGSGKTTTLIECLNRLPESNTSIFVAFNNGIVDELRDRVKRDGVNITTMHSFCWKALMSHYRYKCELKPNKSLPIIKRVCLAEGIKEKKLNYYFFTYSKILDLMRQNYLEENEEVIELAEKHSFLIDDEDCKRLSKILKIMNSDNRNFDFTDMIYRAIKDDVALNKFDSVFVDIIVFHEIKNQFPSGLTHSSSTSTLFSWFPF